MDCLCLLLRSVPDVSVHSWGFLARIFRHSSNGKNFAAIRAGQQMLQGFHLVPSAGFPRLHATPLKPSNFTVDGCQSMANHSATAPETAPTVCTVVICFAS